MKNIAKAVSLAAVTVALAVASALALDGVEPVLATYTGQTSITYTNGNTPMAVLAVRVVSPVAITGAVNLVNSGYTMPLVASATNTVFAYTAGDAPLHLKVGGTITVSGLATNATTFQLYRVPVRYSN
jgi:hypothetical protein